MKDVNGSPPGPRAARRVFPIWTRSFAIRRRFFRFDSSGRMSGWSHPLDGAADIDGDDPHAGGLAAFVGDEVAPELEQKGGCRGRDRYRELGTVLFHERIHGRDDSRERPESEPAAA